MKKYTCTPGSHDFTPSQLPRIFAVKQNVFDKVANWMFQFTESCWYNWKLPSGEQDQDVFDWNKLCGWAPVLEPGNKNGVMLAWRPGKEKNTLEFSFYQNLDSAIPTKSNSTFTLNINEKAPQRLHVRLRRESKKRLEMTVFVQEFGEKSAKVLRTFGFDMDKDYATYREIFLWFGGENNSEGEFGGTPSKEVTILADRY